MKQRTLIFVIVFIAFAGFTILVSAQGTRTENKVVTAEELRKMQEDTARVEATPVQRGVMSPQQKEHCKLDIYKNYKSVPNIIDCLSSAKDKEFVAVGLTTSQVYDPKQPPFNLYNTLKAMAGSADAIVIGVVVKQSSQLTEDDHFIFTDYLLKIDLVLKNNSSTLLRNDEEITITRPGGNILLSGHVVQAIDSNFPLFHKGLQYLIFLKYLPENNSYQALDVNSSFLLLDDKVIKLTRSFFPLQNGPINAETSGKEAELDADSFINEVSSAVFDSISAGRKGER